MNFQPELAAKVMSGEKTVTRRAMSDNPRSPWWRDGCSLKVGRDYAVCPGRGKDSIGRVRIVSVSRSFMHELTDDEVRREGFASRAEFERLWLAMHGRGSYLDVVWRVEFEIVPPVSEER